MSSKIFSINDKSVEFMVENQKLIAFDQFTKQILNIEGPRQVPSVSRCFEALDSSYLILRDNQLTILPRGRGGAGGKQEAAEIPEDYICPITHQLMYDPVVAADGETYEREAIVRHLQSSDLSPLHGDPLAHTMLTPNRALKRTIDAFRQKTQAADAELYLPTSIVQACQTAVLASNLAEVKALVQKEPRLFEHTYDGHSLLELSFETSPATVKAILRLYPEEQKPKLTHKLCAKISKKLAEQGLKTLTEAYQDTTPMNTRLESAISFKAIDYAKAALKLGADPNQTYANGLRPLHQAIDSDSKALISILLQNGAVAKQSAANGQTPIEYAAQNNKPHLANHIAFQKQQLRVRPHLTPLQKQVDQLMAMQLETMQSLERISAQMGQCQPIQHEVNRLHQKLATIMAAPSTSAQAKRPAQTKAIQSTNPSQIQNSDLIELLNQHFQGLDTLVRLHSDGELKLAVQEHKLILHYACAGLLMRIFHLLGIATNQRQLPQLFTDELRPFDRPTAYEYRSQLMHHLFKFRGCTLALLNSAKALAPLSAAVQSLKNNGQATIAPQELSELPINKIARVTEGIEDAVKDQLRAVEDIDQYFAKLAVLSQQAQALKNQNTVLWEHAGLLHFAITTLSCALGQRLKDIASYPAYQTIKNKLTAIDPSAIETTTIGKQTYTATLFEIDRLRFGHAYNDDNLAPGRANVNKLREKAFVLISPRDLEKRLRLGSQLAPTRVFRQELIPLFFQEASRGFSFTTEQVEALSQALGSHSAASSSSVGPSAPLAMAFGKADWAKYFGGIGTEPPLPRNIEEILNGPCPIWSGKKVRETHMLTLIPSHVNGKQLTLESLGELVKSPKGGGCATKCHSFLLCGNKKAHVAQNTWVLMTRDVLPDSRSKRYENQSQLVANLAKKSCQPYEVPHLIEAVTSIFMEYVKTGTWLYGKNPVTYTRCQDKTQEYGYQRVPMIAGGFAADEFLVNGFEYAHDECGVGCLRKIRVSS